MGDDAPPDTGHLLIEPLEPGKHDRAAFSCGVDRLDNFLKRTARKQQAGNFTRMWVAGFPDSRTIAGYYALNAHSLEGTDLPASLTKGAPGSGAIPAVYLSMIAVDRRHQARGLGRVLLADALRRAEAAAQEVGLKAVVLDVIDDGGPEAAARRRAFHERMGFRTFPSRPSRMFIAMATVREALGSD